MGCCVTCVVLYSVGWFVGCSAWRYVGCFAGFSLGVLRQGRCGGSRKNKDGNQDDDDEEGEEGDEEDGVSRRRRGGKDGGT